LTENVDNGHILRAKYMTCFKGWFCLHLQLNVEREKRAVLNPWMKTSSSNWTITKDPPISPFHLKMETEPASETMWIF